MVRVEPPKLLKIQCQFCLRKIILDVNYQVRLVFLEGVQTTKNNLDQSFIENTQVEFWLTLVVKSFRLFYKMPINQKRVSSLYHSFIIFDPFTYSFEKLG